MAFRRFRFLCVEPRRLRRSQVDRFSVRCGFFMKHGSLAS